jgi:UDP-GlcNAc:undecaprenyl-phosphate/decaprenyl-phosphate GlcNAc-1-phosphate transferase
VTFDLSPLRVDHLILFGTSFAGAFLALYAVIYRSRRHHPAAVSYAGVVIIGTIVLLAVASLADQALRLGLIMAAILTIIIGTIDELRNLKPAAQLAAQVALAATAAASGWAIRYVTNPLDPGVIQLGWLTALCLTTIWLVFLMNSINWLDGVDGLAASVSLVAFATLGAVSLLPATQDGTLVAVGAGATGAFLLWNWSPAHAYLGTSGAWFLGLYLGLVATVGGGKIATTMLVLALPASDAVLVVAQRLLAGRVPWKGDRIRHLHFRLRAAGLSPRAVSLLAAALSAGFGAAAVLLQTLDKIVVLLGAGAALALLAAALWLHQRARGAITR